MTYEEAVAYLYEATPVYQHIGGQAYKPGLGNIEALDALYDHPHTSYCCIHVAGTNGKGSTSHTLAAILQSAGYRVGLFTSPHLVDFRERIRVNGQMITQDYVADFVMKARGEVEQIHPSFFELTTMMALCYFRHSEVDVAVIEVGLGGRLDSTNIIRPVLSIITNISLEHTQFLGNTLGQIAAEKAGIIKPLTPVVVGNASGEGVREALEAKAQQQSAPLFLAEEAAPLQEATLMDVGYLYKTRDWGVVRGELTGLAQVENTRTILTALECLRGEFEITPSAVAQGFAGVCRLTGLMGRWQTLSKHPRLVCDTGHNAAGLAQIAEQLRRLRYCYEHTHFVLGMASDKDVVAVLKLLPRWPKYYFTQASTPRSLPAERLAAWAHEEGLEGEVYSSVAEALEAARASASSRDLIFVGGSNFVVADLLESIQ